jgi:hypothetical protein
VDGVVAGAVVAGGVDGADGVGAGCVWQEDAEGSLGGGGFDAGDGSAVEGAVGVSPEPVGVTAAEAADAEPVPALLRAMTVKV